MIMRCQSIAMWTGLAIIIYRSKTCTQSTPLKKFVIFTLSVPICTPLNTYFHILVLAAPIRRGKMPSKLHQETRKAQETQRCIPEHNSRDKKSKSTEKSKRVWFCSAIRCVFAGDWQLVLFSSIS